MIILLCSLNSMCFCLDWLLCQCTWPSCPYRTLWPEVVYCKNYIVYQIVYMLVSTEILVSIISPSFFTLHFLISEIANVLTEGVYCCFTRTTLFTTMFTVIIC